MTPSFFIYNSGNMVLSNTEKVRDLRLALLSNFAHFNYSFYILITQFASVVTFAFSNAISFASVFSVFNHRSEVDVIRIYARRVVALVKSPKSFWNFSIVQNPRCSTRHNGFLSSFMFNCDFSIAFFISKCYPIPAGVCFFNFTPKSFSKSYGKAAWKRGVLFEFSHVYG